MGESIIQRSFAAGEIAPVLHARADQVKYVTGLRTCRNFLIRREGGASNRAGFKFVDPCKTDTYGTRLMRFVGASPDESFLIEAGTNYFRFYQNGAVVVVASAPAYSGATAYVPGDIVSSGGAFYYCHTAVTGTAPPNGAFWYELPNDILEIPTTYAIGALPNWNQSGNVLTLTSVGKPPAELIYLGEARWVLRTITTSPAIAAPQNVVGVAGAAGARTFKYIVTAAAAGSYEESHRSATETVSAAAEPTVDAPHALTWDAQTEAAEFYVYCDPYQNGVFGYIGTAASNSFKHAGQTPDFNLTPPLARLLFDDPGEYPALSANYQQRRWFANSTDEPDSIWGSRIGFRTNFTVSSPIQDDDAVTFRLAGNNHHSIRHMVALKAGLVLLTDGGEWTVTGGDGPKSPITPASIAADQETYVGVSPLVRPVVVGNAILYVQSRGSIVRDLHFDQEVEGLAGRDLTIWATHLFKRRVLYAIDFQQVPHSIIWCIRNDGTLLGLTYIPDQDIWGWHRHDTTNGVFEDLCVVPEEEEDVLYVIVRRTISGISRRYIERLERRELLDGFLNATSFFVDSGLSYSGAPATTLSGLDHLEGQRVAVLADGAVIHNGTTTTSPIVTNGAITLAVAASNVHIGLPITADLETLDLDVEGTDVRDKKKRIASVTLLLEQSSRAFQAGETASALRRYDSELWESAALAETGQYELTITTTYTRTGHVLIRHTDPTPLTVLGVIPHVDAGG